MVRNKRSRFAFVLMLVAMLALATVPVTPVYAAACVISTSTTWSALTCGTGGGVPTAADTVEIRNGAILTVNVSNAVAASLQAGGGIGSGAGIGTLTFNSGSSVTVSGSVTLGGLNSARGGTIDMTAGGILTANSLLVASGPTWIPGTGTVILAATNTLPGAPFTTFNNLIISGGTTTTGVDTTINGNLSIGNGATFTAGAFALTVTGTTTVGGGTSGSLTVSSATGAKTFNGLITIDSGGTWTNTVANSPVTFHGGITNFGTFNAGTGVHTFDTKAQALAGALLIPSVTVTGVTLTNNGALTVGTALAGTGGLTNSATGTLNIGGTSTINTLTATAAGNTVNYNGAAQTVKATSYSNLIFSGSGAKSITLANDSTLANGDFSIAPTGTAIATIAGTNLGVSSLTLGGVGRINGTWGSTGSAASNQNDTYFTAAATGYVVVSNDARPTVTFDANGGTGSMLPQKADTPTALTLNAFTRTGYTFTGWNTAANGSGTAYADNAIYPFTASTTLYAQWTINQYSVTYNGNGSTSGTVPTDPSSPYDYGSTVTVLGNSGLLVKTGYTFAGWNTAADGSGTSYAPADTFTLGAANVTLYAQWTALPNHTVTFNSNGGTGTMSNQTANVPTALTLNTFTRAGYSFSGWNTAANGTGTAYANGATYPFAVDVTLYAQWMALPNHTVTFNGNGGTGTMSNQVANIPTALTLNAFTRTGYSFSGWNTAANGTGTAYANGATYPFAVDATLYAQWMINIYLPLISR